MKHMRGAPRLLHGHCEERFLRALPCSESNLHWTAKGIASAKERPRNDKCPKRQMCLARRLGGALRRLCFLDRTWLHKTLPLAIIAPVLAQVGIASAQRARLAMTGVGIRRISQEAVTCPG